jgi:nicotinamidase-related amidase
VSLQAQVQLLIRAYQQASVASSQSQVIIGGEKNFWLYSKTHGYDITHPPTPKSPPVYPRITVQTTKGPVAIAPAKTALVVVDMQNFFLSPSLGGLPDSPALKAVDALVKLAIPACRKAGIPIVWLNWGLTEQDIDEMPPTIIKGFAFGIDPDDPNRFKLLGSELGQVTLEDGSRVDAGRVLMRNQWNSASYSRLEEKRESQDVWIDKNRLSGLWGGTEMGKVLTSRGIRTLFFAGVNTDQCVSSTLQDAYTKGWDCLLLSDGCATTSPLFAKQSTEYNCEEGWGFVLTCNDLAEGVDNMQTVHGQ